MIDNLHTTLITIQFHMPIPKGQQPSRVPKAQ